MNASKLFGTFFFNLAHCWYFNEYFAKKWIFASRYSKVIVSLESKINVDQLSNMIRYSIDWQSFVKSTAKLLLGLKAWRGALRVLIVFEVKLHLKLHNNNSSTGWTNHLIFVGVRSMEVREWGGGMLADKITKRSYEIGIQFFWN